MKKTVLLSLLITITLSVFLCGCGKVEVEGVSISEKDIKLQLNDTYSLSAEVSPENAAEPMVYWESSDASVATVKSGVISAVGKGEATITAFTKNGVKGECKVTVDNILTKKLTLNKKSITMMLGTKEQIHYTIVPEEVTNSAIDWESSNIDVATVDDGEVVAKGAGTCEITAETTNGVKAKCSVTVKIKPTGVSMQAPVATVRAGKTIRLSASVKPSDSAYTKLVWESSDEDVATVDSKGNVKGISTGTCKIYATTSNNKYDYCKLTVTQGDLTYKGTGNKTLKKITVSQGVYAISLTHSGSGIFKVIGSDGEDSAYTYASVTGEYKGTNLYANGKNDGVKNATIKIAATGDWTIRIYALADNGTDNITGTGECVTPMFRGSNEKDTVQLINEAEDGDFTAFLYDYNGRNCGVLCDQFGDYEGTCNVTLNKNKYYFIIVKSEGKWSIDFGNNSKQTTVKPVKE